jgi:hypothetical protein
MVRDWLNIGSRELRQRSCCRLPVLDALATMPVSLPDRPVDSWPNA